MVRGISAQEFFHEHGRSFLATQHATLDKHTFKAHLHPHFLPRIEWKFKVLKLVPKTNVDP